MRNPRLEKVFFVIVGGWGLYRSRAVRCFACAGIDLWSIGSPDAAAEKNVTHVTALLLIGVDDFCVTLR
jgi:hypothetical protein